MTLAHLGPKGEDFLDFAYPEESALKAGELNVCASGQIQIL